MQLWFGGMLERMHSGLTAVNDFFDGNLNAQDIEFVRSITDWGQETRVVIPPINAILNEEQLATLSATIDPLQECNAHGITTYVSVVDYINSL